MIGRDVAEALDAADPLAWARERFVVPDPALVYLDGNSLGRLPKATVARLRREVEEGWGGGLVGSWDRWVDLTRDVGDAIARHLLGGRPGECVVADSTTVVLFKLLWAAAEDRPGAIACDPTEFPTDRYVAESVARRLGRALVPSLDAARAEGLEVAVAVRSIVDYRTGELADVAAGSADAHAAGALALWDASHAVGSVPLALVDDGADLAAGCTYKHLCGGPGAPAWLWVREEHHGRLRQPISGWWGQRERFSMDAPFAPLPGAAGWASGTPPVLQVAAVEEGVRLVAEAGTAAIRAKSELLTDLAERLHDERLGRHGCTFASPRDPSRRGAHVAVRHPAAAACTLALRARGVVPDLRPPDVVRVGLSPLTTRFVDVWDGLAALDDVLAAGAWRPYEGVAPAVT